MPRPKNPERSLGEFEVIDRFFTRSGHRGDGVVAGIGDDAAVVSVSAADQLVIATDSLVQGTHFPAGMPAHALGHRCLAVNLSDLAAMGAEPMWCTLALSLPATNADWLEDFSAGFFALADSAGIALIGGDTVRGPLAVTVTVHGRVPRGEFISRRGAQPGDDVYVTGTLGDAAAGLDLLAVDDADATTSDLQQRFLYPQPRLAAGMALHGIAGAMIDISDGLHVDLSRLVRASAVGAELDVARVPLSASLATALGDEAALLSALTGGDDYELCFTVARGADIGQLAAEWPCGVTRIGRIVAGDDVTWLRDEEPWTFDTGGFVHFD